MRGVGGDKTRRNVLFIVPFLLAILAMIALIQPGKQYLVLALELAVFAGIFILVRPEVGLYALIALIPFTTVLKVLGTEEFGTGLRLVGFVTIMAWMAKVALSKKTNLFQMGPQTLLITIFLVMCLVSTVNAGDFIASLKDFSRLFLMFAFFVLVRELVEKESHIMYIRYMLVASTGIHAVYGLAQYVYMLRGVRFGEMDRFGDATRIGGLAFNSNIYALFLLVGIPIMISEAVENKKRSLRILFVFMTMFSSFAVALTASRTGMIGLALIIIIYSLLFARKIGNLVVLLFFGALAIALVPAYVPQRLIDRSLSGEDTSMSNRYYVHTDGMTMFRKSPIFGIGLDNFAKHHRELPYTKVTFRGTDPHSTYLQVLVETGVVGFSIFMVFLLITLFGLIKSVKDFRMIGSVFMSRAARDFLMIYLAFLIFSTSNTLTYIQYLWMFFGLEPAFRQIRKTMQQEMEAGPARKIESERLAADGMKRPGDTV